MTDTILIVGGGVAGLTAAELCVEAGARAIVVDNAPVLGGRLAPLLGDKATQHAGVALPGMQNLAASDHVETITSAELTGLDGSPGNFVATIRERARWVTDACTRCGHCKPVCPSVSTNAFDLGLTYRKAIFTPLPETVPPEYAIDIDSCLNRPPNYLPCDRCVAVCDDNAIHFDFPAEQTHERHVGAVIVSTGFDLEETAALKDSGYGAHPDVVTSAELGRLLMAPGPTGGFAIRPSNEEYPESVLWVLEELTPVVIATAADQCRQLLDQGVGEVTVLSTTQARGGEAELEAQLPGGVTVAWGLLRRVEAGEAGSVTVTYAEFAGTRVPKRDYDLVVHDAPARPRACLASLSEMLGCELDDGGYLAVADAPNGTSRTGVFVAGGVRGPITLAAAADDARAAATAALAQLDPRLLRPDYAAPGEETAARDALLADELEARIQRALTALVERRQ